MKIEQLRKKKCTSLKVRRTSCGYYFLYLQKENFFFFFFIADFILLLFVAGPCFFLKKEKKIYSLLYSQFIAFPFFIIPSLLLLLSPLSSCPLCIMRHSFILMTLHFIHANGLLDQLSSPLCYIQLLLLVLVPLLRW